MSGSVRSTKWRSNSSIRLVLPTHPGSTTASQIDKTIQRLRNQSLEAVTPALPETAAKRFLDAGFVVHERLHLFSKQICLSETQTALLIRDSKRRDLDEILKLDQLCFDKFWRFDKRSLNRAKRATRHNTTRITEVDNVLTGYCITGATGQIGYIQRLGVDPNQREQGIGGDLVRDSLSWLYHQGCEKAMVNTQLSNVAAQNLYLKLGFQLESEGLVVLKWQRKQ